jgi:hypothetical protein
MYSYEVWYKLDITYLWVDFINKWLLFISKVVYALGRFSAKRDNFSINNGFRVFMFSTETKAVISKIKWKD